MITLYVECIDHLTNVGLCFSSDSTFFVVVAQPTVMHLACVQCHMTLAEAFVAATLNAAYSIGRSDR